MKSTGNDTEKKYKNINYFGILRAALDRNISIRNIKKNSLPQTQAQN